MTDAAPQRRERTINWPRMRPRFTVELPCRAEHVMAALRRCTEEAERSIEGAFSERHGVLSLPEEERQFWSTHLGLTIEDARTGADGADRPTRVLGVFSPHPEIWTAYVFVIGTLALIGASGLMYAVVQLTLGSAPWALGVTLFTTLVGALVYTSTLVGQGLALGEMYELRRHVDDCLDRAREQAERERAEKAEAVSASSAPPMTARESAQL